MGDEDFTSRTPTGAHNQIAWLDDRLRAIELKLAEHLGRCGDGGTFAAMEADVRTIRTDVAMLKDFRGKALLLVSIGVPIAGFVAALVSHWLEKLL